MRFEILFVTVSALLVGVSDLHAAKITGQYLESRTCDVYTGPCFANAEMGLAGKEAIMAWKVEKGEWNNVSLDGMGVAIVLDAEGTIGFDGVFPMQAGHIRSVILVDEKASALQEKALIAFAKDSAKKLTDDVLKVIRVPFKLENNHENGTGIFEAGKIAKIETRKLTRTDCVCTNELVYYQPLTKVRNFSPAYSKTLSFQGKEFDNRWTTNNIRSSFLATFRR